MKANKPKARMRKRTKIALIVSLSVIGSHILFLGAYFTIDWLCFDLPLKLTEDLRGYPLSVIQGSPERISQDEWNETLARMSERFPSNYLALVGFWPQEIPEEGTESFFFHEDVKYRNKSSPRDEWYLSCVWDSARFQAEKERLLSISGPFIKGILPTFHEKKALGSQDLFPLPACIFVYNDQAIFQYAIFDEVELRIHYIFLDEIGSLDSIVFDKNLAPTKRTIDSDIARDAFSGYYSIYF